MLRLVHNHFVVAFLSATLFIVALMFIPAGLSWQFALGLIGGVALILLLLALLSQLVVRQFSPRQHSLRTSLFLLSLPWLFVSFVAVSANMSYLDPCRWIVCSPATWTTQLAVAERHAWWSRRDFVLTNITAQPPIAYGVSQSTEVSFTFVAPSGESLLVILDDLRPRRSVHAIDYTTESPLPPADVRPALASVTITPAHAFAAANAEGNAFLQTQDVPLDAQLSLAVGAEIPPQYKTPVAWSVLYFGRKEGKTNVLEVWIDARTGMVLGSKRY